MNVLSFLKSITGNCLRWLGVCSILLILIGLSVSFFGCANEAQSGANLTSAQQKCFDILKSKAPEATLTILPILIGNTPVERAAQVFGVIMERAGMKNLDIGKVEFCPDTKADFQQVVNSFGQFIGKNPVKTDYVFYGQYKGTPKTGIAEIRGIILDKAGEIVWLEQQKPEDAAFKNAVLKPKNPLTCTLFLAERLRKQLELEYYSQKGPVIGRLEKKFAEQSGLPKESERLAMKQRLKDFKKVDEKTKFIVFPVKIQNNVGEEEAAHLANVVNEGGSIKAVVATQKPNLEVKWDMNEQATLWSLARSFRQYLRENKPDTDYSIYAQYLISPKESTKVLGIHFVVCDRNGEWVIVDFQNKYQSEFKKINPTSTQDCNRLVAKRLGKYLN
jgi:hypothetical protein